MTNPEYWNNRARKQGYLTVVRKGFDREKMDAVTEQWWQNHIKPVFREIDNERDSKNVLEVGCGVGRWKEYFQHILGYDYTGVDVSEELVNIASENHGSEYFEKIEPGALSAFDDDSFFCVISITVLQHVNDQVTQETLNEMARVMQPDGFMFLIENTTNPEEITPGSHVWFRSVDQYNNMTPDWIKLNKKSEIHEHKETMTTMANI